MKANELRIGNYHYYHVIDNMDERKEWDEVSIIDIDDIAYLSKNEDDNYKPIPLTEEWLLKLPKKITYPSWIKYLHELQNWYYWNNEKKELDINL